MQDIKWCSSVGGAKAQGVKGCRGSSGTGSTGIKGCRGSRGVEGQVLQAVRDEGVQRVNW